MSSAKFTRIDQGVGQSCIRFVSAEEHIVDRNRMRGVPHHAFTCEFIREHQSGGRERGITLPALQDHKQKTAMARFKLRIHFDSPEVCTLYRRLQTDRVKWTLST